MVGLAVLCGSMTIWLSLGTGPAPSAPNPANDGLVVHEWGTFTSFAGSDGVPVHFTPNNSDLPNFVYYQEGDPNSKVSRLEHDGTVSMETPVMYFYTKTDVRASIKVEFAKGWITEWYPFAIEPPADRRRGRTAEGQTIRWDVKLLARESGHFPTEENKVHYYEARDTDAVPVQAEVNVPKEQRDPSWRGGKLVQQEKFLFYRGVGNFPLPVTVQALGKGKVRFKNGGTARAAGLLLLNVHNGKVGARSLDPLDAGAEATATLPQADSKLADVEEIMVKELTAAGLFEKEARAMVKTWDSAWFADEGTRLLYRVPRSRTDELLRLTVEPRPTEVQRVLVGRHDFLTPEVEGSVDSLVKKMGTSELDKQDAEQQLAKFGRFANQARAMAENRLHEKAVRKAPK